MTGDEQRERMQKALDYGGGLYTVQDIAEAVRKGEMQWWQSQNGEGHCVTCVCDFPQKRVLHVVLAFGQMHGTLEDIQGQMLDFAQREGCDLIEMGGRWGWSRVLPHHGWDVFGVMGRIIL